MRAALAVLASAISNTPPGLQTNAAADRCLILWCWTDLSNFVWKDCRSIALMLRCNSRNEHCKQQSACASSASVSLAVVAAQRCSVCVLHCLKCAPCAQNRRGYENTVLNRLHERPVLWH
jgi:hypothetical protein